MVFGNINNNTTKKEYDHLSAMLNRTLGNDHLFPKTILDTMHLVDSVPDESAILSAQNLDALFILWGNIDTSENSVA